MTRRIALLSLALLFAAVPCPAQEGTKKTPAAADNEAVVLFTNGSHEERQRIALAVQRIRAKVPENQLRLRQEDVVVTPKFTIVGRIVTPKIKAKAEHFGDLQLSVAGLRTITWNVPGGEVEVTV